MKVVKNKNKKEKTNIENFYYPETNLNHIEIDICDSDQNIVYVNRDLLKKYGEIGNRKCYEYFHNKNKICSFCKFDDIKTGKTIRWEWKSRKDNKIYEIIESPIKSNNGSIQKLRISYDITEIIKNHEKISDMAKFPEENPNPVLRTLKNGKVIYSNAKAKKILEYWGLKKDEFLNKDMIKLIKNVYKLKKVKNTEFLINNRYFSFVLIPIINNDYINIYGYDITEQKILEEEQKRNLKEIKAVSFEAEKKAKEIEAVFGAISEPIVIYDKHGKITNINHAAEKTLNYNPAGLTQDDILQIFKTKSEDGENSVIKNLVSAKAFKNRTIKKENYHYLDDKNIEKVASVIASPIEINNKIEGFAVVWHDITDLINKENKLIKDKTELTKKVEEKNSEISLKSELLDIIFSNTYISIAYFDTDFNFIRVNNSYAKEDHKTPDFYRGKNHFELFPNDENKKIFTEVIKSKKPYFAYAKPFEYINNPERGITYWDWTLQPVLNKNHEVDGLILTLLNVSDRVINDLKIKNATAELEHSKRLSVIGKLAATVAHELRNPLAVIESACYNIERKCKGVDIEKHISNIGKKISEAEQLIINLLAYTRIKLPNYEKTNLVNLINDSIDNSYSRFSNHKTNLVKNYSIDEKKSAEIDPVQIQEVFINILINAIQSFKNDEGKIEISLNSHSGYSEIIIEDNGCGIEEEDLEKIFDPFFTRKSKGTGLGLSICKEIINLHNGTINITSKKNFGTKVMIKLPEKANKK